MDGITELAKMLKARENKPYMGPQLGKVLTPLPNIKVQMGEKIILTAEHLVIAEHVLRHERVITLTHQESAERNLGDGTGKDLLDTDDDAAPYSSFQYANLSCKFRDTLAPGDMVILIPSTDAQKYFIIGKAVIP